MNPPRPLHWLHPVRCAGSGSQPEPMRPVRRRDGGFSIVEVLIASMILSIMVAAVVGFIQKSNEIRIGGDHRRTARAIIDTRFEQRYRSRMFNALPDAGSIDTEVTIDSRTGTNPLRGTMYTRIDSTAVTCTDNMEVPVKKVTISVNWSDYGEEPCSVSVSRWLVP